MTKRVWFIGGGVALIIVVGLIVYAVARNPDRGVDRHNQVQGSNGTCNGRPKGRQEMTFKNNAIQPSFIRARLCSQIILVNGDTKTHKISFKQNGKPIVYDDIKVATIEPGASQDINLIDKGIYTVFDTTQQNLSAEFMVE